VGSDEGVKIWRADPDATASRVEEDASVRGGKGDDMMYESDASYLDSCTGISLQGPLLGFNSEINPRANRKGIRARPSIGTRRIIFSFSSPTFRSRSPHKSLASDYSQKGYSIDMVGPSSNVFCFTHDSIVLPADSPFVPAPFQACPLTFLSRNSRRSVIAKPSWTLSYPLFTATIITPALVSACPILRLWR